MRHDLSTLGLAAKEGIESAKRVESLKSDVKRLTEENKAVADSFNSERVGTSSKNRNRNLKRTEFKDHAKKLYLWLIKIECQNILNWPYA